MEGNVSWFGRDPAAVVAQVGSALIALVMLLPLAEAVTASLIGVIVAVGGVVVAFAVARDGQLPAIVGLGRAGIAIAVVLGVPWSETYQGLLLVAIEQIAAFFIRDRVTASVSEFGNHVRSDDAEADRLTTR